VIPQTHTLNDIKHRNDATLFVGDLPPHFKEDDLERFFAPFGDLEGVRVMGGQCYAFVTFESAEVVQQIVEKYTHKPLTIAGHELRVNVAHGQLPEWKVPPPPSLHPGGLKENVGCHSVGKR